MHCLTQQLICLRFEMHVEASLISYSNFGKTTE